MDRKELVKERHTSKETKIPLVSTYSWSLPNISRVAHKHGNILSINKLFKKNFQNEPLTAFRCNKKLKELICISKMEYNIVKRHSNIMKKVNAPLVQ